MEGRIGAVTDGNPLESLLDRPPGFASDGSGHGIGCGVGGVLAQYPEARSDAMIMLMP